LRTYQLALVTALACLGLLIAGGLVHATGSGMACGSDWPLCRGEAFPRLEGGVLFEHGHRLAALSVTVLTIVLAAVLWRRERHLRWLGPIAVGLVIVQALLGMLTVRWNLPMAIKTVHLAVSMAFFCLLILIGVRTLAPATPTVSARLRRLLGVAALFVYLQILLGALVRHTGSGLACPDVPLCLGRLWPDWGPAQLQMIHRLAALVVAGVVAVASIGAARALAGPLRALALAPLALLGAQITLGVLSVLSMLGIAIVTAHLATGALLLANLLALYLALAPRVLEAAG